VSFFEKQRASKKRLAEYGLCGACRRCPACYRESAEQTLGRPMCTACPRFDTAAVIKVYDTHSRGGAVVVRRRARYLVIRTDIVRPRVVGIP